MRAEAAGPRLPSMYVACAAAHLAAAAGDPAAVLTASAPLVELAHEAPAEPGFWPWENLYADALIDLDRLADAEAFLRCHEPRVLDRRSMTARLARSRARLDALRRDDARAEAGFEASAAMLRAIGMPYELALTELAHGRFLRRRRRRRAAAESVAAARERFAALGARPALESCDRELHASGLTPTRAEGGDPRLTPQEQTVAELVISGMTNREIAAELMVSTKTIEVHMTRVYSKLAVPSRAELRARARRGELDLA